MARKGENIRKRKDGRWEARYVKARDKQGKIIYGYVYAKTLRDVKAKKQKAIIENADKSLNTKRKKYSFNEITDAFLQQEEYLVKKSTFLNYRNIIEVHIRPYFSKLNTYSLKAVDIENFTYEKLTKGRKDGKGGLSAKTVKDILSVLRKILKYGIDKGLFSYDVLNFTTPKIRKTSPETFENEEIRKIINETKESEEMYKFGIYLCLYTGMRIGEICALKWKDIDLENSIISVNKTMLRLYDKKSNQRTRIYIDNPKTESSYRLIPIPEKIVEGLKKRKQKENSYFLTGKDKYIEPRRYYEKYRMFLKECGIKPHSFHCLRHTFATHCTEIGFDPKTLSEILGHSDVRVTLDRYVHPSMEMKRNCMALLAG